MSKQIKITSFFNNSTSITSKLLKNEKRTIKKKAVQDDDCYIVEDDIVLELKETKHCSKDDEQITVQSEIASSSITVIHRESRENDLDESDNEDDVADEILSQTLDEYETRAASEASNKSDVDDTTIFFLNMVEEFIGEREHLFYLFSAPEIDLLRAFLKLPIDGQKLYVRLYWLQWKWYRIADVVKKYLNCDHSESASSRSAVKKLKDGGFLLSGNDEMSFSDWTSILLRPELIKICNHFKISTVKNDKSELIDKLRKFSSSKSNIFNHAFGGSRTMEKNVLKMINSHTGDCVKLTENSKSLFDRLHSVTYLGLNPAILREKKLNLMLMNLKNNKQSFPSMDIDCDSIDCIFPTKEHFEQFFDSYLLYEDLLKLTMEPPLDHEKIINICKTCFANYKQLNKSNENPIWLHSFTPNYRYIKSMEMSIGSYKAMKTQAHLNEVLDIINTMLDQNQFRQHKRALWYNEKALILQTRLQQHEKAANTLIDALKESAMNEDCKAPLVERAKRLANQKNITLPTNLKKGLLELTSEPKIELPFVEIYARTIDDARPGAKSQYVFRDLITDDRMYTSVEEYSIMHYVNNTTYTKGEHWEGRIIHSIFVLLFWDIIYAPVEGVRGIFISRYQDSPLDLYTDQFYSNRKEKIESRLSDIESGWSSMDSIVEFMHDVHLSRREGEVSLFHDKIEWQTIAEITHCLGRNGLLCMCRRLSSMYHYAHSGFPDLTIWNPQTKDIKFVEVKGDGDKLSHKQIQWMTHMLKYGLQTEVCYVHKGSNARKANTKTKSSPSKTKKRKSAELILPDGMLSEKSPKKVTRRKRKTAAEGESSSVITKVPSTPEFKIDSSPMKTPTKSPRSSNSSPARKLSFSNRTSSPKTPTKRTPPGPNGNTNSPSSSTSSPQGCYLRSPTKFSKGGVGYFVSPSKQPEVSPRKRLSLALTRRRVFEKDT